MTALIVAPGTAEQLARLAWHRGLESVDRGELDAVAFWILGDVGDPFRVWIGLQDDCRRLWHLITDDWDDRDLDELTEAQAARLPLVALEREIEDARYVATRERLAADIEGAVRLARYSAAEARRAARTAVAS